MISIRGLRKTRRPLHWLLCGMLLLLAPYASAADYGYTPVSSTSVRFYANNAPWADLHYIVGTNGQQNVRMAHDSANNNTYTVNGISSGTVVRYFFTIGNTSGGAIDTPWQQFTMGTTGGGPSGYTYCANENQNCVFSGSRRVAYGANGRFNYRIATSSIACNNATFGDPISGTAKACYYSNTTVGPDNYTYCANENQTCAFAGSRQVAYGANGQFRYRTASNSIACNNATFGDPVPGVAKACFYSNTLSDGEPGTVNGLHKRLKIVNGCNQPMWVQWLSAPGIAFNAPNRHRLNSLGSFVEYDIPDKGLPAMRFWPGYGCDANGRNCRVGASGGPGDLGFTCPPEGCAPPIDSKFEATFGCIPGVSDSDCARNPSAPTQPLGRGDWWNSSFVDGYTVPMKVQVHGFCPVGPQPAPVFGPGGPPGGVIDCSSIRVSDCPNSENLSSDGQFPNLSNVNLLATNPNSGAAVGCYSPSAKLTFSHWANGFQTYPANDPHAVKYACPTPPVSPEECSAGPASRTDFHDMVHTHCPTYTYPYDDGIGLSSCPAATALSYEVTFYCPQ